MSIPWLFFRNEYYFHLPIHCQSKQMQAVQTSVLKLGGKMVQWKRLKNFIHMTL